MNQQEPLLSSIWHYPPLNVPNPIPPSASYHSPLAQGWQQKTSYLDHPIHQIYGRYHISCKDVINPSYHISGLDALLPSLTYLRINTSYLNQSTDNDPSAESERLIQAEIEAKRRLIRLTNNWYVVKMKNISWDISIQDIRQFLRPLKVFSQSRLTLDRSILDISHHIIPMYYINVFIKGGTYTNE